MIQARELRIGNKLKHNDMDVIVLEIKRFNKVELGYFEDSIGFERNLSDVEPIPLTEEWLLKFGFISNPYQDRYENGVINIECNKIFGETELWIDGMPHIKYVHQLQNLYYALTGQELELK